MTKRKRKVNGGVCSCSRIFNGFCSIYIWVGEDSPYPDGISSPLSKKACVEPTTASCTDVSETDSEGTVKKRGKLSKLDSCSFYMYTYVHLCTR